MRVWLDDERTAPEGWVHARTPEEAIELLRGGEVEELSLDHDLGLDVGSRERTGYDVLLWLEREVAAGRGRPPAAMTVHSGNVGAVRWTRRSSRSGGSRARPEVKEKAAVWTAVLAGGALLAILGATAASTSSTGSGIGMIVFGLLVASVGLSGLLGVLHDPDATGLMFAFFGILMPGYSLPFLLYYAGKGMDERAESGRRDQQRGREFAAGTRCRECWRPLPGEHSSTCSEYVHRPQIIRRDGSEWVVGGRASVYLPGRSYYTARCSCGWETVDHLSPESAAKAYDQFHGSHVNCEPDQIVVVQSRPGS